MPEDLSDIPLSHPIRSQPLLSEIRLFLGLSPKDASMKLIFLLFHLMADARPLAWVSSVGLGALPWPLSLHFCRFLLPAKARAHPECRHQRVSVPASLEAPDKGNHLSTSQLTEVYFVFLKRQPVWLIGWD